MEACMAAVLVGVMRLLGCSFDGAWSLVCELCLLAVICVDCRCSLSFVFLGGARCLELSPCNTLTSRQTKVLSATTCACTHNRSHAHTALSSVRVLVRDVNSSLDNLCSFAHDVEPPC